MHGTDVAEIVSVVNLYAIAVDTQRWHLFDRVFTSDVQADFGGTHRWQSRDALKRDFEMFHAGFLATLHTTTNHAAVVAGTQANCISYVHGRFFSQGPEGRTMTESGGWYDDELIRERDGWRINKRICRVVWTGANSPEMELYSLRTEAQAGRLGLVRALEGR
jgi:SnoaL-like protein